MRSKPLLNDVGMGNKGHGDLHLLLTAWRPSSRCVAASSRADLATFPIVEREEQEAHGAYRSRELCLAYMNVLAAGDPDAELSE
jgi:hypothetical protein